MSEYLKGNLSFTKEEKPIIEEFLECHNLTTASKNSIIKKEREILIEFANENFTSNIIYFVKDNKKSKWKNNKKELDDSKYAVLKIEDGKIEEIGIDKKDMPANIGVNSVFSVEDSRYVLNKLATEKLKEKLTNMTEELERKQNLALEEHRKEGHLYLVTEEIGDNRFLWDLTDKPRSEFEEVSVPKELLSQATEGIVLKYTNGNYEYYSDGGFDKMYRE